MRSARARLHAYSFVLLIDLKLLEIPVKFHVSCRLARPVRVRLLCYHRHFEFFSVLVRVLCFSERILARVEGKDVRLVWRAKIVALDGVFYLSREELLAEKARKLIKLKFFFVFLFGFSPC